MTLNEFFKGKSFMIAGTVGELHLTCWNIIVIRPDGGGVIEPLREYIDQLIECYNYLQDNDELNALRVMNYRSNTV